jgi:hypothetical protein
MNSMATVPGGIAADNNSLEAMNKAHKSWIKRHYPSPSPPMCQEYVDQLVHWVSEKSLGSSSFGKQLNDDVHRNFHYEAVNRMLLAEISPLTITWPQSGGSGIVIIMSQFTINELAANDPPIEKTPRAYKAAAAGWLAEYKALVKNHKGLAILDFDQVCGVNSQKGTAGFARTFYYLTPIVEEKYLRSLFGRLHDSGLELMLFEDLQGLDKCGLMSCSCSKFLHRAWCIHSCVDAFKKNIITGFPSNMDPTNLKPKAGRQTELRTRGLEQHELCGETK